MWVGVSVMVCACVCVRACSNCLSLGVWQSDAVCCRPLKSICCVLQCVLVCFITCDEFLSFLHNKSIKVWRRVCLNYFALKILLLHNCSFYFCYIPNKQRGRRRECLNRFSLLAMTDHYFVCIKIPFIFVK